MNKKTLVLFIVFAAVIIIGGYKLFTARSTAISGLKVVSNPAASIFLDDKLIGKTPYDDKYAQGEYIIKLIPQDASVNAVSWQTKIKLNPSVLTYVNKELGPSELTSAGEIVYLEKISGNEGQIYVSSTPDAAKVTIDGLEKGITPLTYPNAGGGEHDIAVSSTGFMGRTVRVQVIPGYQISVNFQLALSSEAADEDESATASATTEKKEVSPESDLKKPYVQINDTPTGFLRVRLDASLAATEVAQLKPGDKVPYLDEKSGWYKINYESDKEGWVSGKYAEKVE